jgi:hypothetical protein
MKIIHVSAGRNLLKSITNNAVRILLR